MEEITLAKTSFIQQIFIEKFLCASTHSDISFLYHPPLAFGCLDLFNHNLLSTQRLFMK